MSQSTCSTYPTPLHVGIIMDGNGRWASMRGESRSEGHVAGAETLRDVVRACPDLGVGTLTVYAFSSDNWKRPQVEVRRLMELAEGFFKSEIGLCLERGVRLSLIGRTDRLPYAVRLAGKTAEKATRGGTKLHLRIALDYSARDTILRAAARCEGRLCSREEFSRFMDEETGAPDVDLLIRTGGERRLSDFLLWECAYAELYFTSCLWPDFSPKELDEALADYRQRERRFGGLGQFVG